MTIRIRLNRDSVAMGDDVDDHRGFVELPDEATHADLLAHVVEMHYLASVAGDVAWVMWVRGIASAALIVERGRNGAPTPEPKVLPIARPFWEPIRKWGAITPEDEPYEADFRYVPNAQLLDWSGFEAARGR